MEKNSLGEYSIFEHHYNNQAFACPSISPQDSHKCSPIQSTRKHYYLPASEQFFEVLTPSNSERKRLRIIFGEYEYEKNINSFIKS